MDGLNGVVIQPTTGNTNGSTGVNNTGSSVGSINPTAPAVAPTNINPVKINSGSNATQRPSTPSYSYRDYQYVTPGYTYSYDYDYGPREEYSPAGGRNLKLTLTSTGIIDPSTGQFIKTNTFRTTDTVSVKFKILNEEDTATGPWDLQVVMPAADPNDRVKMLTNLSTIPGESSYAGEARFTGIDLSQGTPIVQITADPNNRIGERNESDNSLTVQLGNIQQNNPGYGYPISGGYNYGYPCDQYYNSLCNGVPNSYYNGGYTERNMCYNYTVGYYYCNPTTYTGYNYGNPNLKIHSIEIGRMIGSSFYQTTTFSYGERVIVRARIQNDGGYYSNQWAARLTTNNLGTGYRDFNSGYQSPIQANGDQIVYFELSDLIRGNHTFTVYADSQNNVSEVNENDNTQSATIYVN